MTFLTILLLSFLVILTAFAAMATGVLIGRKQLRGSCGGIAGGSCTVCGVGPRENARESAGETE